MQIVGISHRYGAVEALADVHLDVAPGEFVTLLGPSGCGKTTLLRVIAGLIKPRSGAVMLDGQDITHTPPHKRPLNMVFQRPTLFPHLNVAQNVAFGLRLERLARSEIAARVQEALELVRLADFGDRQSYELSGGQMQRIALARALAKRPSVLLLDEPLSALDLKVRLELEAELRRIHRETRATMVFVTHDQREALALSDRVVVFDNGRIEQVGTPGEIYRNPASAYVASFVGDANVIACSVAVNGAGPRATLGTCELPVPAGTESGEVWLVVRSEAIELEPGRAQPLCGTVKDVAYRGGSFAYQVCVDGLGQPLKAEVPARGAPWGVGDRVALSWQVDDVRVLPRDGGHP